jgi:hypothetical protein
MNIVNRFFGRASAASSQAAADFAPSVHSQSALGHSQQPSQSAGSQGATKREILNTVLRDTLMRHGIPASWITGQILVSTSRGRDPGFHWRLVVNHWDPRFPAHSVAFQNSLIKRIMNFDPMAANWLMGISWQYALEDESMCPAMPHPGTWTSVPAPQASAAPRYAGSRAGEGPMRIGGTVLEDDSPGESSARADLERLLAVRDEELRQHARSHAATEPMSLATEAGSR